MFVKQVDMNEAFHLAIAGQEVKVLVPTGPGNGWACMEPDTLQNILGDVMFFRSELEGDEKDCDSCSWREVDWLDRCFCDLPAVREKILGGTRDGESN